MVQCDKLRARLFLTTAVLFLNFVALPKVKLTWEIGNEAKTAMPSHM